MKQKRVEIKSKTTIGFNSKVGVHHKADFDPEAIYMWAINEKTAKKKVKRDLDNFIKTHSNI